MKKILLIVIVLIQCVSCDDPRDLKKIEELVIPKTSNEITIELGDSYTLNQRVLESDFDEDGLYRETLMLNKLDYINDVDIFSLPIKLVGEEYRYQFDYEVHSGEAKVSIFNSGTLTTNDEITLLKINRKTLLEHDVFNDPIDSTHVFKVQVVKIDKVLAERTFKFKIVPTVSRALKVVINQIQEQTTNARGDIQSHITLSKVHNRRKQVINVGRNCGIVCERPFIDENRPEMCMNHGGMEKIFHYTEYGFGGNYHQRVHFSDEVNDFCRCDGINAALTVYACKVKLIERIPIIQMIDLDNLRKGEMMEFKLDSHNADSISGKLTYKEIKLLVPNDLQGIIFHEIDAPSGLIRIYYKK